MTAAFVVSAMRCGFWIQLISKVFCFFFFFFSFLDHSFGSDTCFKYPASSPFCFTFLDLFFFFFFCSSCGFYFFSSGPLGRLSFTAPGCLLDPPQVSVINQFFLLAELKPAGDGETFISPLPQNVSSQKGTP